jgi:hypothetical protein
MTLPNETISVGARRERCEFCGQYPTLGVYESASGFYIGYACCMPYSRESSNYWPTKEEALEALRSGGWNRRV